MAAQTGLALPMLGGVKPVYTDIRTTPYLISRLCLMRQLQAEAVAETLNDDFLKSAIQYKWKQ